MNEGRGIPFIGAGPSVIAGTDPVQALLAKERRQEKFQYVVGVKISDELPPMPPRRKGRPRGRRVTPPSGRFF